MHRRQFCRDVSAAALSAVVVGCGCGALLASQASPGRRQVMVGGRRVRTVDVHAHVSIPDTSASDAASGRGAGRGGGGGGVNLAMSPERLQAMDAQGIDVEVLSVNPFWYSFDRGRATRAIEIQNAGLAALVGERPDRFAALASVALQYPDLAADQLETAVTKLKMRGVLIGGSVEGAELSDQKFDVFWERAQALNAVIFIHPQNAGGPPPPRLQGNGVLGNVIGNPLETTIALSHLIFEGTLDRYPRLKICAAHGGGYLASYAARMDHGCDVFPAQCTKKTQRKPSEYLRQIYFDSLVFTDEGLRHLVAEVGASQIMIGTDYPYPWTTTAVDHVLNAKGLTDSQRTDILGGTATKLFALT